MFWRGVVGYLPVKAAQGLVGLLSLIVFTRLLTPEAFGAYALGLSVMMLVHTALFTWIEAAMARFLARAQEAGETDHHIATLYRVWVFIGVAFPFFAAAGVLLSPIEGQVRWAIVAGLAAIPPMSFYKLAVERRRAAGEVSSAAKLEAGQAIGAFALGALFCWLGAGGAGPLWGMAVMALMRMIWTARGEFALASVGRFEPDRARLYLGYGLPVALSLILAIVLGAADRFLIAGFLGEAEVGVYHAGYSLANRTLDVMFIWFGMASGPALVSAMERGGPRALKPAAREQASFLMLLVLPAATGLALVARPLAQLLVGPEFAVGAAQVTPWIALSALFSGVTTYYLHQAFTLSGKTRWLIAVMAIPATANIVLNTLLIPRFGLPGALWATAASYGLGAAASWLIGRRVLALPLPWDTIGRAGVASAAMAAVVLVLPAWGGLAELVLKAGVGATIYALVAYGLDAGGVRGRAGSLLAAARLRTAA